MECVLMERSQINPMKKPYYKPSYNYSHQEEAVISPSFHSSNFNSSLFSHQFNTHDTAWEPIQASPSDRSSSCSSGTLSDHEPVTSSKLLDSPLPPRVYKPCFVCGDRSSGYHYGVASCEGCKGFFRRSVQKNMRYICHNDEDCSITKHTRSRCQCCRFKKCLAVGMLRESVRNERRKKRGKEKKGCRAGADGSSKKYPIPAHVQSLLQCMSEAHIQTSPSVERIEKFRTESQQTDLHTGTVNLDLWSQFSERSTKCIVKIVEFAKHIPGFTKCTIADQITLIKAACMDVLVLRLCSRYHPHDETMTLSDGLTLDKKEMQHCGFGPITEAVYNFAENLYPLHLDDTEIGLLCALCIVCTDRPDLEEPKRIDELQEPLIEALRIYSRRRRPQHPQIFPKLLLKIADLRTISLRGTERAAWVNFEIPSGAMPPLISEMLLRGEY